MGVNKVKNPGDGRYLKSRHRLFSALNQLIISHTSLSIRPVELYTAAGLCKSTFYRHFKTVPAVLQAENAALLQEFQNAIAKIDRNSPDLSKIIFSNFIVHFLRHQDFYTAIFVSHQSALIEQLFLIARPHLTTDWRHFSSQTDQRIFTLYVKTLLPILEDWQQNNFSSTIADSVIAKLILHSKIFTNHLSLFEYFASAQLTDTSKKSPH